MPKLIDRYGVLNLVAQGAQLVDVLGAKEYEAEHLPGAISIPLKMFRRDIVKQLDSRRPVIVYCHDYQ